VFSAEYRKFMRVPSDHMVQFLALGLQIPDEHPDRKKYFSMQPRKRKLNSSDVGELTLMSPGDILFLYTDGVYDGSDEPERHLLEEIIREHYQQSAKDLCNALLEHAIKLDDVRLRKGDVDLVDDKTVFIIKRT
jgi:serine/threonine protein phosphatase PrpC